MAKNRVEFRFEPYKIHKKTGEKTSLFLYDPILSHYRIYYTKITR